MAASLQMVVAVPTEPYGCSAASARGRWEVHFSRFVVHRTSASPACPDLIPLRYNPRKKRPRAGTWLSAASPASLQLLDSARGGGVVLTVLLGEKIMEEHFVPKLHFTWPQVSCMSGFPARGSRAVLVSYRDCADQVQKFALRFPSNCEVEEFMNSLQKSLYSLNNASEIELPSPPIASDISSPSEFGSSEKPPQRCQEKVDAAPGAKLEPEPEQPAQQEEAMSTHGTEVPLAVYPPSFISLLTSCQSGAEKATGQPNLSHEALLRSQIMTYMEDSAFQEMLMTVEKVIGELGADLTLQSA